MKKGIVKLVICAALATAVFILPVSQECLVRISKVLFLATAVFILPVSQVKASQAAAKISKTGIEVIVLCVIAAIAIVVILTKTK